MAQTEDRLDLAIKARDDLAGKKQRIEGRLEAAKKALGEVETECRTRGIEPADLDKTISQMDERYRVEIEALEQGIAAADAAIAPFLKET